MEIELKVIEKKGFDFTNIPSDILNYIIKLVIDEENKVGKTSGVQYVNQKFGKIWQSIKNQNCVKQCEKMFHFTPPIEKAYLFFKICLFIEANKYSHFEFANKNLTEYAKKENPWACYYLSRLYSKSPPTDFNKTQEKEYFKIAIEQGFAPAFRASGIACLSKEKIPSYQTTQLAIESLDEASEKGDPVAKRILGKIFLGHTNTLIPKDTKKGLQYLYEATELNDILAICLYAEIFRDGKYGFSPNSKLAIHYYVKAIDQNSSYAAKLLWESFLNGAGCIKKNKVEAFKWGKKYYELTFFLDGKSARKLGLLYRDGHELLPKDVSKAVEYFEWGIKLKDKFSALYLARIFVKESYLYEGTEEGERDVKKAIECYRKACAWGLMREEYQNKELIEPFGDSKWLRSKKETALANNYDLLPTEPRSRSPFRKNPGGV